MKYCHHTEFEGNSKTAADGSRSQQKEGTGRRYCTEKEAIRREQEGDKEGGGQWEGQTQAKRGQKE
jgi:hypothetical protein